IVQINALGLGEYITTTLGKEDSPLAQVWAIRLASQKEKVTPYDLERLSAIATKSDSPMVRREIASAAIRLGHSHEVRPTLRALVNHKEDANGPTLPQLVWTAYEPVVASEGRFELKWLQDNATGNPLITDTILPRAMRRLVATGKPGDIAACVVTL